MNPSKLRGDRGEALALQSLLSKGYVLLEKNYRWEQKEIDLIMKDGDVVVFIEVKARSSAAFGTPGEAVNARKQQNLLAAAQAYLISGGQAEAPARMDVVEVFLKTGSVHHIENAFGL